MSRGGERYQSGFTSRQPVRSTGRKKPIKSLTAYNYVVKFDVGRKLKVTNRGAHAIPGFFASPIREESYNVRMGELLFQSRHSKDYLDGVHVFSFANGLGVDWHRLRKQSVKKLAENVRDKKITINTQTRPLEVADVRKYMNHNLLQDIQFSGVALTDFNAEGNNYQNVMQGFVSTIGGVCTIVNTGQYAICPGQWVMYSAPAHNSYDRDGEADKLRRDQGPGIPLDKQVFETVPYDFNSIQRDSAVIQAVTEHVNAEETELRNKVIGSRSSADRELEAKEAARTAAQFEGTCSVLEHMSNRVIGKALSYSRPGECFDILLGGRPLFFM